MDLALILSALMLGIAGAPHCAAMCGPASGSLLQGCRRQAPVASPLAFHLARVLSYAIAGAVAASSVSLLAQLGQLSPVLRPLWTLLHCAALGLGLWLLWQGRQPAWLENLGRSTRRLAPQRSGGWQRMQGPTRASAAGLLWVAWPCGLLQSALVVAALANTAWGGAAAMAGFAAASAAGLGLAPWAFARLAGSGAGTLQASVWAVRVAGAALAAASAWALGHDLFRRVAAYCLS
ncbi:MAG: sulfite exporter TauE/SafE family protein [Burkholderiaceae bacterium]|jgi:sulfite exporter TauE/SafE|nr:sulfite exporter TauE/SafE family protein [Burkholderiaceae bacterium]